MWRYPVGDGAKRTRTDISGGDDRIRTCEGLLTLNGLANRRLQPLGHISARSTKSYFRVGTPFVKTTSLAISVASSRANDDTQQESSNGHTHEESGREVCDRF